MVLAAADPLAKPSVEVLRAAWAAPGPAERAASLFAGNATLLPLARGALDSPEKECLPR